MSVFFSHFARRSAVALGSPWAFLGALVVILLWALSGPFMGFSDVWQLTINTGTTIVTFLMIFLVQNTQNRDSAAVQIKLDELIHVLSDARDELVDIEDGTDEDLARLRKEFETIGQHKHTAQGKVAR